MRPRRKHERFVRRLEIEFTYEGRTCRAITSDFSRYGLFIRTNRALVPGTELDIIVHLPNNTTSQMRGLVRRAMKTPVVMLKNGMGIELIKRDANYINFLKQFDPAEQGDTQTTSTARPSGPSPHQEPRREAPGVRESAAERKASAPEPPPEHVIIACPSCGAKNKVLKSKLSLGPKCGKCKAGLVQPS